MVEAQDQAHQQQQDAKKGNETKVDSHVDTTKMAMGDFGFKWPEGGFDDASPL